jgi:hypothetical protein
MVSLGNGQNLMSPLLAHTYKTAQINKCLRWVWGMIVAVAAACSSQNAGSISLSNSPCFQKPSRHIHSGGLKTASFYNLVRPLRDHTYDYRGQKVEQLPSRHLFNVDYPASICIVGPTTLGTSSRTLTWKQVKEHYDTGGISFTNVQPDSDLIIEGVRIVNVEDGLMLPREPEHNNMGITWTLRHAWMEYIRDDAIENDSCLDGNVQDVLIDGTHMGFAARPGKGADAASMRKANWLIEDTLMHLNCKPDTRVDSSTVTGTCATGTSVAQIFKQSACSGSFTMRNTIIRVDAVARHGPAPMAWAPGYYQNVTLVWLGPGDYPMPLPPGVRQTKDISVWNDARALWLERHGCDRVTKTCRYLERPE